MLGKLEVLIQILCGSTKILQEINCSAKHRLDVFFICLIEVVAVVVNLNGTFKPLQLLYMTGVLGFSTITRLANFYI